MTNQSKVAFLSATLAVFLLPAAAQTSTTPPTSAPTTTAAPTSATPAAPTPASQAKTGPIYKDKQNQQNRIANGVGNGELTAGEASTLENKEHNLNQEDQAMRNADNGHLTAADQKALSQQQKQLSNQIYKDKHNANVQNTNPQGKVGQRAEHEQDRIASGVKNGELNPNETRQLESKESAINKEAAADRAANGGKLTSQEKNQINHQQNKVGHQIYKDKHNAKK